MLEVHNPSNVLNISGEFQREMPIQARRNWSDFLEITPGVHSRPFDDGSGRMVYFGHSTEHFAHVVQLEGAIASNYQDAQITYVAMGADMVERHAGEDRRRRRLRADGRRPQHQRHHQERRQHASRARAPSPTSPASWNGNNVSNCSASAPATRAPRPPSARRRPPSCSSSTAASADRSHATRSGSSASLRRADLEAGISRTRREVQRLECFYPNAELFNNTTREHAAYGR